MKTIGLHNAQRIAMNQATEMGLKPTEARPHELILAAALTTSDNNYTLSLDHKAQQDVLSITKGLEERDMFIAVAWALGIAKVPIINSTRHDNSAEIVYHPDAVVFPTAATVDLSEAQALMSIYLGQHTVKTNQGVRIDGSPNLGFLTRQETQGAAATVNMTNGVELKEIGAALRFAGGDSNEITHKITCLDKTHIAGAATHANFIIMRLVGAVIKGGTSKAYLK